MILRNKNVRFAIGMLAAYTFAELMLLSGSSKSAEDDFILLFGYVAMDDGFASSLVHWVIPVLLLTLPLGRHFEKTFIDEAEYILTRTTKVRRYTAKVCLQAVGAIAVSVAASDVLFIIAEAVRGKTIGPELFSYMSVYLLFTAGFALLINCLSLFMKPAYACVSAVGSNLIMLCLSRFLYCTEASETILRLIPTSRILFYQIYTGRLRCSSLASVLYFCLLIGLLILLTGQSVKQRELL